MPIGPQHFTVSFTDVPDTLSEDFTPFEATVERTVQCNWSERFTLMREFLGYIDGVIIYPPHKWNPGDGGLNLQRIYARNVRIAGHAPVPGSNAYKYARLTVTYQTPSAQNIDYDSSPREIEAGTFIWVTESLEPSSQFLTLSRKGLYFGTGGSRVSIDDENLEAPSAIVRAIDWVYTLHSMPYLPQWIYELPGKVNSSSVYSFGLARTFPAETLLCGDPACSRQITNYGSSAWEITLRFTYQNNGTLANPKGWNYFPRTDNNSGGLITWEPIYNSSDVQVRPYQTVNFASVIL